jgi:hypothetical protein
MSLLDTTLSRREEVDLMQKEQADRAPSVPRAHEHAYSPSSDTYDHTILDSFYVDDEDMMTPSQKQSSQKEAEVPVPPPRSALRASKLLDSFDLKLAGPVVETQEIAQATPHDFYLSSEEDASSSADDFSEYDWDSELDEPNSPASRRSREDTARVVSVVYSGKPSIIDLSLIRRSFSPSSDETRSRATASTESLPKRPSSPSSISSGLPPRTSSMLESLLAKPKPNFLKIDPYANGSTYSLSMMPSGEVAQEDEQPRTPRTPTAIMHGMSRTFSLVRKRSRPALANLAAAARSKDVVAQEAPVPVEQPLERHDSVASSSRNSTHSRDSRSMTYNEIMQMVKRNIKDVPRPPAPTQAPATPVREEVPAVVPRTPTAAKRLLGNLSARRKSIHRTTGIF